MKDGELIGKIHSAMYHQCQGRGDTAPVDVLMDISVFTETEVFSHAYINAWRL